MLTTTIFEPSSQIILIWKCPLALILMPDGLKHLVIEHARLFQAWHKLVMLLRIHKKAIFKRSHTDILLGSLEYVKNEIFQECAMFHPHV